MSQEDRPKRNSDRWYLHGFSDEVRRCVKAARVQMGREMPAYASEPDYVIAHLFVAHALLEDVWKPVNAAGVKERSYKLAEAMSDITQILIDLTERIEDDLSGKWELERRKRFR